MSDERASKFPLGDIGSALGEPVARLIEIIATIAQKQDLAVYLAGGVARDLLLGRRTLDLDLAVEGDAIQFAKALARGVGGEVQVHRQFGTAKWILDESVTYSLLLALDGLPSSVRLRKDAQRNLRPAGGAANRIAQ